MIINIPGIVLCVIAFTITFSIGSLFGIEAEAPQMMILGPLIVTLDLLYRFNRNKSEWKTPSAGGCLFCLPLWIFGVIWFILGTMRTLNPEV